MGVVLNSGLHGADQVGSHEIQGNTGATGHPHHHLDDFSNFPLILCLPSLYDPNPCEMLAQEPGCQVNKLSVLK